MTLAMLNEYRDLVLKESNMRELIYGLRAKAGPQSPRYTGMPHNSTVRDKVSELAIEIADLEARCAELRRCISEYSEVEAWISDIPDDYTRIIFRLRYIRAMGWQEVADCVGGNNTAGSVKAIAYRYLENL